MLSDRTYLLFKPRQNLPNDRLNIRQDNSYTTTNSSNYRSNPLSHSSSYERLSYKSYSSNPSYSTPLPNRKYTGGALNSNLYDNNYDFNSYLNDYTPRRRTATFGSGSQNNFYSNRKPLQRSDSFGSTIGLYEKSGNMEKREMLMSSFNRHTNAGNSSNNWFNRLKLNNLFNSSNTTKNILPPRPSSNFYNNYSKSNYSTYKSNPYRVNYLNYDDYFRPKIRTRPLFSDIRKSIMHKSGITQTKNNRFNYTNNYNNKFNKNNGQNFKNASVLSNGSSGGLSRSSSSSGDGSISYTQQSTTTTSPSETPILQSQKSIRKVDRYRSVIKFAEHNIGKTYADRKNQINWEIDADDPFGNNDLILNKLVDDNLINDKIKNQISYENNLHELNNLNKEIENIWNVITDTTILTHSSSTNTLSDLNVGYEQCTDNEIANKLEQQFADIKRKNDELEKLKIAFENDNQLNTGKRKLHKSVNLKTTDDKINLLNKKSKSVKISTNVIIKDIKTTDPVEQIDKAIDKFNKLDDKQDNKQDDNKLMVNGELINENQDKNQDKTKRILKTSKSPLTKKPSKVKIQDDNLQKEIINKDNNNLNNDKFKNKQQTFKTLFVKPEIYIVNCNQGYKKTEYSKQEIYSTLIKSSFIKTIYQSPKLEIVEKKTKLIKTDYKRLELEIVIKLSPLIKTDYEKPKVYSTIIILPLRKTDYEKPKIYSTIIILSPIKTDYHSPKLMIVKVISPLIKSDYHKPIIEIVQLKSDLIKTDYFRLKLVKTKSTRLPHPKTSYYQPEIMVAQLTSPLYKTDYHKFKLEQIMIKLPMFKTNYEHLEWYITKPIISNLIKTDYQSPKLMIIKLNTDLIKTDYQSPKLMIIKLNTDLIKTDYISFPIQVVIKEQEYSKTEYFKYPIQITQSQLANSKTEYFKVPIQEVNLKINFNNCLDYQYPVIELKHQASTGKPPLNPSINQLNRSSRKSTLNNLNQQSSSKTEISSIDAAIKNTLSSIKSVLSLNNNSNDLKRSDEDGGKKKVKKVKKVKVGKKSSSVSGTTSSCNENNENKLPNIIVKSNCSTAVDENDNNLNNNNNYLKVDKKPLLARSISLDQNDNYQINNSNNFQNTFHIATASKEQYKLPVKRRIVFRKYNINDFYLQSVLGRGSFGKVFLAELVGHDVYFAIKCLKKNVVIEDNDVESTMIERKVLALGSTNPFICKLFCTFQTDSYLCFAMEYLAGGDLMFHVQKQGRFDEARARFYAAEIVCALKFLHRRYIIYRDLKLDNVLLDQQGHIRLVDFGMCQCKIYRQECLPSNFCGTPDYMAPEIIKGVKYNNAVDWWSFGVLLYEMLIGKSPFTGADEDELLWNVCNEKIVFPLFLSQESVHIIALLLNRNPDKRLGVPGCPAGDITQQQFFDIINWEMADAKLLPPPFIPDLSAANDISNFDKEFTDADPALTPVDDSIINELNHDLFEGFDYTNPNMTD